jgi:hypothetical protein
MPPPETTGHTAGKLTTDEYGGVHFEGKNPRDRLVLTGVSLQGGSEGREEAEANTRRLLALWNAAEAAHWTTDEIEALPAQIEEQEPEMREMGEAVRAVVAGVTHRLAVFPSLLAACEAQEAATGHIAGCMRGCPDRPCSEFWRLLDTATALRGVALAQVRNPEDVGAE